MRHFGMKTSLYKYAIKSNSRRDGLCRYKLSIIMGGISMKMRVMNMQMVCIVPFIGKTSIICRQPHYTVHGMLYLYLWHKTEPLISCAVICLTAFNARYRQGMVTATGSLIYTNITERVKVGDAPADFQRLAPSFTVSLQPWQEQLFFLRLMYKSTFRTPTFNDLYYYRLGNRSLRPEKANEYNIGITWSKPFVSFLNYFSVTIDGYYNDVTDKIVAFPTTYAWKMANYGKVRATGIDATLAAATSLSKNITLVISGGYTFQKAIDLTDPTSKSYKDQLPYTPEHSGNVSAILEMPWVNVGYSIVGVSERYSMSQNIPENRIDGYMEHTVNLSKDFSLKRCKLRLQAEIVNLTDTQYDVIKYYPMPGRSWRLTGTIEF